MLCRSYLYGAVLDKPKQSASVGSQGKPGKAAAAAAAAAAAQQGSSKARVVRTQTSAAVLSDLVARWRAFKDDVRQVTRRHESESESDMAMGWVDPQGQHCGQSATPSN